MGVPRLQQQLGDYELLYEIKSGGMGKVFLGRKRSAGGFEKLVAVKTILKELSSMDELRTMFFDEAKLLARLQHPGVAQVYDFGEQDGRLYLAMEYVQGVSFAQLKRMGTPPIMAVQLAEQACSALHSAHTLRDLEGRSLEVVHRDVSPENLMLSFDGHVKVLDFGIALMRGRQSPATEFGTIKGKPPYMSPEQVKGERIDRRTDLWSMGVVLWELLTGENLFEADSLYGVARAVGEDEIQPPSSIAGQLPEGLDAVVMRALSRELGTRYQSGEDMAADLRDISTALAAPSVGEFAGSTLQEAREQHELWLRDLLRGESGALPVGRPTGMRTAVPGELGLKVQENQATSAAPSAPEPAKLVVDDQLEHGDSTRPGRRFGLALALVVLLCAAGVGLYFGLLSNETPSASLATTLIDAGATDAASIALVLAVDAAVPLPPDARAAAVVERVKKGERRTRPRGRVDAGVSRRPERVPEPAPVETSVSGVGKITIAAEPFALVRVDGVEIGATPLFGKSFPAGTHVVELIHPDTGKVRLRKTVILSAGAHKRVIAN